MFTLDITQKLANYEIEYHVLQEEMSYNSRNKDSTEVIAKLEATNNALKRQNLDLLGQLQVAHSQNQSLEAQLQDVLSNSSKLKSHISTLEIERAALLNTVAKLRKLVTDDVLQAAGVSIPNITPELTHTNSVLHSPAVHRILEEESGLSPYSGLGGIHNGCNGELRSSQFGGSLPECDKEVASLTRSYHNPAAPHLSVYDPEQERPSSTTY